MPGINATAHDGNHGFDPIMACVEKDFTGMATRVKVTPLVGVASSTLKGDVPLGAIHPGGKGIWIGCVEPSHVDTVGRL